MTAPQTKQVSLRVHGKERLLSVRHRPGRKPALLFLHALGAAKECFDGFWDQPLLAEQAAYAVDLPGFGASGKPANFSYSLEAFTEVLEAFLLQEAAREVIVVGHSMGGAIGLLLAEKLGPACKAFFSLEGNLTPNDPVASRQATRFSEEQFLGGGFGILKAGLQGAHGKAPKLLLGWMGQCGPLAYYKSSLSLVAWSDSGDLLWKFEQLPCAKAYFYGDHTRSLEAVRDLEGEVECIKVPGAGHFLMLDNPKEFYEKLAETVQAYL